MAPAAKWHRRRIFLYLQTPFLKCEMQPERQIGILALHLRLETQLGSLMILRKGQRMKLCAGHLTLSREVEVAAAGGGRTGASTPPAVRQIVSKSVQLVGGACLSLGKVCEARVDVGNIGVVNGWKEVEFSFTMQSLSKLAPATVVTFEHKTFFFLI